MNQPIRIGLIGATGRLGRAIDTLASEDPTLKIAARFHSGNLPEPTAPIDLFLDVSAPSALLHNLHIAMLAKKPLVIGTTGHATLDLLQEASCIIPIFYSPNFSLGMALMQRIAAECARRFPKTSHIDLIESHHSKKQDAPSGSAKALAETIKKEHPAPVHIHSIRSGNLAGEHILHFNTNEEKLTIIHEAHNRNAFAQGALIAAKFLVTQSPGLYGMNNLLDET